MSIRRTKAQKVQAQIRHSNSAMTYSFSNGSGTSSVHSEQKSQTQQPLHHPMTSQATSLSMADVFSYDVGLIYRDLIKTVLLTVTMFAVLIGLTFII